MRKDVGNVRWFYWHMLSFFPRTGQDVICTDGIVAGVLDPLLHTRHEMNG
jgi:hypothetical protein